MKRIVLRVGIGVLVLVLIVVVGFVVWASNAAGPGEQALQALQSGDGITVDAWEGGYTFRPQGQQPSTGLIFYPGGRVDFRSYAPALRQVAAAGFEVVLVKVPLNLAVFNSGAAAAAADAHPQVQSWAVGGHSLGGAMAALYAHGNPEDVNGLVLWASYPAGSNDLSSTNLPVASIYGSRDGVAAQDQVESAQALLPASTRWTLIEGGNHAQFGDYGEQAGDGVALISASEQWQQTARATVELLQMMER
jgi:pimeloyl-ACP methyl ester carboxylesterase